LVLKKYGFWIEPAKVASIIRRQSELAKTFDKLGPPLRNVGPGTRHQHDAARAAGKFFANPIVLAFFLRIKPDGNFEICRRAMLSNFCR